jgi:endonuclease YncB( thermonuclease family)
MLFTKIAPPLAPTGVVPETPMTRRRTLVRTGVLSLVALAAVVAHRYVLPSIGIAERGPVPIGTITRLAAQQPGGDTAAVVAAFARSSEAQRVAPASFARSHSLAGSEMSRLPEDAVARLRNRPETASEVRIDPAAAPAGRGGRPSPADADPLPLLPDPTCIGAGCPATPAPRLADPEVTGTVGALAAIGGGAAPDVATPVRQTRVFSTIEVVDGRTFRAGGTTVRLANVALPERGRRCQRLDGTSEPCIERTRTRLDLITRHRPVTCDLEAGASDTAAGVCRVGDADLSLWLIREGWALPSEDTPAAAAALAEARRLRAGLWR